LFAYPSHSSSQDFTLWCLHQIAREAEILAMEFFPLFLVYFTIKGSGKRAKFGGEDEEKSSGKLKKAKNFSLSPHFSMVSIKATWRMVKQTRKFTRDGKRDDDDVRLGRD
jgi:hypothetical protein